MFAYSWRVHCPWGIARALGHLGDMMRHIDVDRLATLRVQEVMSPTCLTVQADQTMDAAAEKFLEHRVSGMPVVDVEGQCIGVLSATDYIWHERSGTPDDPVELYMSPRVISVHSEQLLLDAAVAMVAHHIHRVVVVDHEQRAIGVVSSLDVVNAVVSAATGLPPERIVSSAFEA